MKSILLLILLLGSCAYSTFGQSQAQPPSLQMGLNGLTFQPGILDAELILTMVAEKQEEIKKKAVKNLILRQVNEGGGTVYIFADNVLNAMINEKDNMVRTRTILENTVNLVFAMALTEYVRRQSVQQKDLEKLLEKMPSSTSGKVKNPPSAAKITYDTPKSFQSTLDTNSGDNRSFLYTLDIVSEAIRTNKRLNALGLMRITYPGEWDGLNQYVSDNNSTRKETANRIKQQVDERLEQLLNNVGFITDQLNTGNFSYPSRTRFVLAQAKKDDFPVDSFDRKIIQTINTITLLLTDTSAQHRRFRLAHGAALTEYWAYLRRIRQQDTRAFTLQQLSDIMYHLTVDVRPEFEQIGEFVPGVGDLFQQTVDIQNLIRGGTVPEDVFTDSGSLMRLVAKLYQFKKAKTYSDYLNIMTDLPALVGNPQVRSTLNTLLVFIKNYVVIRQDASQSDVVAIDVESLLVMLQQYSQNRPRTVQFMFTVGANTAYRSAARSDTVHNFTFVGEKIGIKVKIIDWSYLRSFNKQQTFYRHAGSKNTVTRLQPPQEPVVSNLHLLLYGSGILYNLIKSSNNISFHQPLLGIGAGVTFINSLDVNLSMSFPQKSNNTFAENFSYPFVSLGFDLLFLEYLDRLVKKRKNTSH